MFEYLFVLSQAWSANCDSIYSCSDDGHLARLAASTIKSPKPSLFFRPDGGTTGGGGGGKQRLLSLALHPDGSSAAVGTAAGTVLWVDLDARLTLRTFGGGHRGGCGPLALLVSPALSAPRATHSSAGSPTSRFATKTPVWTPAAWRCSNRVVCSRASG